MLNFFLSVAVFAAILLLVGAWNRWQRDGGGQQSWLMIAAALVILVNIAIWVVPDQQGKSLATEAR